MKKIRYRQIIAGLCMSSLVGCGSLTQSEDFSTQPQDSITVQDESQVWEETTEVEQIESDIPVISIETMKNQYMDETNTVVLMNEQYDVVSIENEGYDALAKALSEKWPIRQWIEGEVPEEEDYVQWAIDDYEYRSQEEKEFFYGYSISNVVSLKRCDRRIISFTDAEYSYTGGAHGNYGTYGVNFDVETGAELQLRDILADEEGFYDEAFAYLVEVVEKEYADGLFPDYQETMQSEWENNAVNWYLDATGIVIVYTPYEIGPYAMGEVSVTLPYTIFGTYMQEEYLTKNEPMVSVVSANIDFSDAIGLSEEVMLQTEYMEENYTYQASLVCGEYIEEIGELAQVSAILLTRSDQRSFLFGIGDYESEDYVGYVYELSDAGIRKCEELEGVRFDINELTEQTVIGYQGVDVLGSYRERVHYTLQEDGTLVTQETVFQIESDDELTVSKELPVTVDEQETTLPVGTKLIIIACNNIDTVYFETTEGIQGSILYEQQEGSYQVLIDGVLEYEYFEMLPYAG